MIFRFYFGFDLTLFYVCVYFVLLRFVSDCESTSLTTAKFIEYLFLNTDTHTATLMLCLVTFSCFFFHFIFQLSIWFECLFFSFTHRFEIHMGWCFHIRLINIWTLHLYNTLNERWHLNIWFFICNSGLIVWLSWEKKIGKKMKKK